MLIDECQLTPDNVGRTSIDLVHQNIGFVGFLLLSECAVELLSRLFRRPS
jgi:hypothetical protein